jgi:hypothetical protein
LALPCARSPTILAPPWYGREMTGYEVANLPETIAKAQAAGVVVLVKPYAAEQREAAMLQFPGGYIAEVHAPTSE